MTACPLPHGTQKHFWKNIPYRTSTKLDTNVQDSKVRNIKELLRVNHVSRGWQLIFWNVVRENVELYLAVRQDAPLMPQKCFPVSCSPHGSFSKASLELPPSSSCSGRALDTVTYLKRSSSYNSSHFDWGMSLTREIMSFLTLSKSLEYYSHMRIVKLNRNYIIACFPRMEIIQNISQNPSLISQPWNHFQKLSSSYFR